MGVRRAKHALSLLKVRPGAAPPAVQRTALITSWAIRLQRYREAGLTGLLGEYLRID